MQGSANVDSIAECVPFVTVRGVERERGLVNTEGRTHS